MITDLLQSIATVGQAIYQKVQQVKGNQAQCQVLKERVRTILQLINGLDKVQNADQYKPGLIALEDCLKEALNFIVQFTKDKSWFKQAFKANSIKEKVEKINEDLQKAMDLLNLGMNAKQIIDHEADVKAQREDIAQFIKQQDLLIKKVNDVGLQNIQETKQKQDEMALLLKQFASLKRNQQNQAKEKSVIEPHLMLSFNEFEFGEKIGCGSFGTIYLGNYCDQTVAIKTVENTLSDEDYKQFVREVQIMSRLRSPHIVQLYGACLEPENLCLSMEYMDKGSLNKVLTQSPLTLQKQKEYALSIAKGLSYLHKHNIVHCDLKSSNILINSKGEVKITDFGLSKTNMKSIRVIHEKSQAIEWQAPECLKLQAKFTSASDVYAFGMILWELTTGKKPFAQFTQEDREKVIIEAILAGKRETIPSNISPIFQDLIKSCWEQDPFKRPALKSIIAKLESIEHEQSVKKDKIEEQNIDTNKIYEQGIQYENDKKYAESFEAYKRASELGHIKAQTNLGFCYLKGQGTSIDLNKAFQCLENSSKQGHARAMVNLALMYKHGRGVEKDITKAREWYGKAAALGDPTAIAENMKLQGNAQVVPMQKNPVQKIAIADKLPQFNAYQGANVSNAGENPNLAKNAAVKNKVQFI